MKRETRTANKYYLQTNKLFTLQVEFHVYVSLLTERRKTSEEENKNGDNKTHHHKYKIHSINFENKCENFRSPSSDHCQLNCKSKHTFYGQRNCSIALQF